MSLYNSISLIQIDPSELLIVEAVNYYLMITNINAYSIASLRKSRLLFKLTKGIINLVRHIHKCYCLIVIINNEQVS